MLVFPSGQTIRWQCTSSTEMERRSQWRARLEIRCLMSSSTRTSTLMALVCKHTHLLSHTHTHTEIYRSGVIENLFPFLSCFSISILFPFLIICDIRVKTETFLYLTWLKLVLQTITKRLCAVFFCFLFFLGACEGTLACSTCHVIFDEDVYKNLGRITDEEMDMLDLAYGLTDT